MKNKLYNEIKNELKKRRENTKYFNREFFNKWIQAIQENEKNIKDGINDSYKSGYITLYHCYDEIYKSDFYNKNGGCYCEFLAVVMDYKKRLLSV